MSLKATLGQAWEMIFATTAVKNWNNGSFLQCWALHMQSWLINQKFLWSMHGLTRFLAMIIASLSFLSCSIPHTLFFPPSWQNWATRRYQSYFPRSLSLSQMLNFAHLWSITCLYQKHSSLFIARTISNCHTPVGKSKLDPYWNSFWHFYLI